MGRIEELATRYRGHIGAPWQRNLAGDQKAIFVVYPKTDERKAAGADGAFEMATTSTGHRWRSARLDRHLRAVDGRYRVPRRVLRGTGHIGDEATE